MSVLFIVLPIFALIFAGWLCRRLDVLGPNATRELNRFVVYLALPALLLDIVAKASWSQIWQPGFVGAFGIGVAVIFVATIAIRLRAHGLADAAVDGLNAAYGNTGYIGFPLAAAVLGAGGATPTLVASIITICILFAVAIVLIEVGLEASQPPLRIVQKVAGSLARNPLVIAPVLGAVVLAVGRGLPVPVDSFLKLLGGAASPCALVALGLFLAEKREAKGGAGGTVVLLTALKLLVQPVLTWWLATRVFALDPFQVRAAVLLAALPTGTGPFMLAEFYRREAGLTAKVVLASTVVSLFTITGYLAFGGNEPLQNRARTKTGARGYPRAPVFHQPSAAAALTWARAPSASGGLPCADRIPPSPLRRRLPARGAAGSCPAAGAKAHDRGSAG